jgi:hypothetical protein
VECIVCELISFFAVISVQLSPRSPHSEGSLPLFSSNKNKSKGSNIGDAIIELLMFGGMPASVIEARLVDGKKLELGAGGNQSKCVLQDCLSLSQFGAIICCCPDVDYRLSRSLQKLQRAGIVIKVTCGFGHYFGL